MYKCVTSVGKVREYLSDPSRADSPEIVAFDFETAPDEAYRDEERAALDAHKSYITGVSFSVAENSGIYVPLAHRSGENADETEVMALLAKFAADPDVVKVTSQNIAHGQAMGWEDIERVMNLEYQKEDGTGMVVALACVDSGDGGTMDEVLEFCARNAEWAVPIKGSSISLNYYRISTINRAGNTADGTRMILIDGDKYKNTIASRLNKPNGQGSFMVYKDCDREYAEQITAEHKVNKRKAGRVVQVWEPKTSHADNHYLDCEVYAFCAADLNHVRNLHLQQTEPIQQPAPEPEPTQTIDWIGGGSLDR